MRVGMRGTKNFQTVSLFEFITPLTSYSLVNREFKLKTSTEQININCHKNRKYKGNFNFYKYTRSLAPQHRFCLFNQNDPLQLKKQSYSIVIHKLP